ncbi:extra-cytoplasmic solute receptor family protein 88 [Achromobacter xylosoxidans A8]|uniref:Extra-cytoplasmic solute receptor family protein 88 n=1 Tax=Achromobacter xylosoxidans (strain A8) TaxID=762376 RepID=E3HQ40_ACHXA|nr:tripartite tricarboxylate transporter substrate binding protein [Achromobacter xylosoxidans]ADP17198.1 extra-cytoplasmic solute receptor family protein 88 [Achromobacter xylosoxidans A8]
MPSMPPRPSVVLLLRTGALLFCAALLAAPARADYPERPVRLLVGVQAGASTDTLTRQLAQRLSEQLGRPFVVENKPGAATRIAMEAVSRAPADGYTLGVANAVSANFPMMFDDFAFIPGKDFTPISLLGRAPSYLAIRASLPVRNVQEFVAYAQANKGKLNYGQGSNGSNPHLAARLLVQSLGIQATEVAYKGNAPTGIALASGEIDFAILEYPSVRPLVERGSVRLLAVTEPRRAALAPDVPTSTSQGLTPRLEGVTPWFMLVAPAGTPANVIERLNREVNQALRSPDVRQAAEAAGLEPAGLDVAETQAYFLRQRESAAQLSHELNVSLKN